MNSGEISQLRDKVASLQSELQNRSATISALSAQLKAAKAGAIEKEADLRAALDAYTFAERTGLHWAGLWSPQTLALGQSLASLPSGVKKVPVSASTPSGYVLVPVPQASLWVWPLVVLVWAIAGVALWVLLMLGAWGLATGQGILRNLWAKWQIREHEAEAKQLRNAHQELSRLKKEAEYIQSVCNRGNKEIEINKEVISKQERTISEHKPQEDDLIAKAVAEARAEAKAQHLAELRAKQAAKEKAEQAEQAKRHEAEEKLGDVLRNLTLD